jgi:putative flippase GtrA
VSVALARHPRRDEVLRFVRFLALGGLAAGVNWLSRFAWEPWLGFSAAVVAAYATGMLVAFLLFRAFVFPASPTPIARQVTVFALVNLLGVVQVWLVANGLAQIVHPALAHAIGIAVPTLTSWFGHKSLTFRS